MEFIKTLIASINKKYNRRVLMLGSEALGLTHHRISSGSVALDADLAGGSVVGKLFQISSKEYSVGKSVLCASYSKSYLNNIIRPPSAHDPKKRFVLYVDLEDSFDPMWVQFLEVDMDRFILAQPIGGEETWDIVCEAMDQAYSGEYESLTFVDSLPAAIPMDEVNKSAEDNPRIGAHALLTSRGIKKFLKRLNRDLESDSSKNTICFVNQTRVDIKVQYGDPEREMGGRATGFQSSHIIRLRRGDPILDDQKRSLGFIMKYTIIKDKTGGQEKVTGEMTFYRNPDYSRGIYGGCFDNAFDIIPIAERFGILERNGHAYRYSGSVIGISRDKTADALRKKPELYAEIEDQTMREVRMERTKYAEAKSARIEELAKARTGDRPSPPRKSPAGLRIGCRAQRGREDGQLPG